MPSLTEGDWPPRWCQRDGEYPAQMSCEQRAGSGYLQVMKGEMVTVLYIGNNGDEKGWFYAEVRGTGKQGWLDCEVIEPPMDCSTSNMAASYLFHPQGDSSDFAQQQFYSKRFGTEGETISPPATPCSPFPVPPGDAARTYGLNGSHPLQQRIYDAYEAGVTHSAAPIHNHTGVSAEEPEHSHYMSGQYQPSLPVSEAERQHSYGMGESYRYMSEHSGPNNGQGGYPHENNLRSTNMPTEPTAEVMRGHVAPNGRYPEPPPPQWSCSRPPQSTGGKMPSAPSQTPEMSYPSRSKTSSLAFSQTPEQSFPSRTRLPHSPEVIRQIGADQALNPGGSYPIPLQQPPAVDMTRPLSTEDAMKGSTESAQGTKAGVPSKPKRPPPPPPGSPPPNSHPPPDTTSSPEQLPCQAPAMPQPMAATDADRRHVPQPTQPPEPPLPPKFEQPSQPPEPPQPPPSKFEQPSQVPDPLQPPPPPAFPKSFQDSQSSQPFQPPEPPQPPPHRFEQPSKTTDPSQIPPAPPPPPPPPFSQPSQPVQHSQPPQPKQVPLPKQHPPQTESEPSVPPPPPLPPSQVHRESAAAPSAPSASARVAPQAPPRTSVQVPAPSSSSAPRSRPLRDFAEEVRRINSFQGDGVPHWLRILDLTLASDSTQEANVEIVKKRRKEFWLLLHPDKRSEVDEARAGGKQACSDALQKVQNAAQSLEDHLKTSRSPQRFNPIPRAATQRYAPAQTVPPKRTTEPPPPPPGWEQPARKVCRGLFIERDGMFIPVIKRNPPAKHFPYRRVYDVD